MDTNLNPQSYVVYTDRDIWNQAAVYGEKLSPDGNLLFAPLSNGIDVIDGKQGTLRMRIALPFPLSANYDALVGDGRDNVLIAITGQPGDGIAVIDLTSLPEGVASLAATTQRSDLLRMAQWTANSTFAKPRSTSLIKRGTLLNSFVPNTIQFLRRLALAQEQRGPDSLNCFKVRRRILGSTRV